MHRFLIWYCILSPIVFALVIAVLGFITPGYDPVYRTISELVLGRYGWIQQANFIQFTICLIVLSHTFPKYLMHEQTRKVWTNVFRFCALMLAVVTLFPTPPLESLRAPISSVSPEGIAHWFALAVFFVASPVGIWLMSHSIATEPQFRHLARITSLCGYTCCILTALWLILFYGRFEFSYFGLLQKVDGVVCVCCFESFTLSVFRAHNMNKIVS